MNKFIKAVVLSALATATVLPTLSVVHADDRYRPRRIHRHHGGGDAVALGALGLATGVIIGGAIASQPRERVYTERVYVDPEPEYYEPAPVYRRPPPRRVVVETYGTLEPWTREWYNYCADRYRSFNPRTGTFRGYDGRAYFCTAG
ncbi:BA14K family protein [Ensifer soli]|uniref:BA14K family protein n=1 Tax=Ciceribacter sp. sgz301302 TaxID=3342379 RepID=UPI0035BB2B39